MKKWKEKCFDLLSNSINVFFKEMYGDQSGKLILYVDVRMKELSLYFITTVHSTSFLVLWDIFHFNLLSPVADEKCIPRVWRSDPFEKKNH